MSKTGNMEKANCLAKLHILAKGMNERFPEGNEPYQIATRIMEECGEVAAEINHAENSGSKVLKRGAATKEDMAGEIRDAMNALMQLALYYDVEQELEQAIEQSISRLKGEGYLKGAV